MNIPYKDLINIINKDLASLVKCEEGILQRKSGFEPKIFGTNLRIGNQIFSFVWTIMYVYITTSHPVTYDSSSRPVVIT